jgi:choline dehydrogenase
MDNAVAADNDVRSRWDFFVKHSDDPARELKYEHMVWRTMNGSLYVGLSPPTGAQQLGIWYPRASVLGGCAMHNAGISEMPTDDYWDDIANLLEDKSWRASNMRRIFEDIENCQYEAKGTPGHGFSGWVDISPGDNSWLGNSSDGTEVLRTIAELTGWRNLTTEGLATLLQRDMNALGLGSTNPLGVFTHVTHSTPQGIRVSPANYIKKTLRDAAKYPLTVQLNSFMTKLVWGASNTTDHAPSVVGVEYAVGQSVYQGDPRYNSSKVPEKRRVNVTREVIISGGAFNSPQILKVNGIGPASELKKFNIPLVSDLPGVGRNLGDNYEGSVVALAARPPTYLGGTYEAYLNTSQSEGLRDIYFW